MSGFTMKGETFGLVQIIADGAIANSGTGEGRLVPVVVVETKHRRDFEELVANQAHTESGDVISQWAINFLSKDKVYLNLRFINPSPVTLTIPFYLNRHSGLVEGINISHALYLQPSSSGLRVRDGINSPKILIEIPPETKLKNWDQLFQKTQFKKFRDRGLDRQAAKKAARDITHEIRSLWLRTKM